MHAEFVVKRMPGTGHQHHLTCHSFEPEAGLSGLGELIGEAIVEHAPEQVEIRTAFPLARGTGRPVPRGELTDDPASISALRKRMSLRAVLHFLYDRAGFNRLVGVNYLGRPATTILAGWRRGMISL